MITSFLIMFRESLEASLIIGIILGYLLKTKQTKYNNLIYVSIAAGIAASIAFAYFFHYIAGGFEGLTESIFEGVTMIIASLLLTFMMLWMMRQRHVATSFHKKMQSRIDTGKIFGLFMLGFIAVLREGVETAIFLFAASYAEGLTGIIGAFLGVFAAIVLGYLVFVGAMKISIKKFFNVTSILLILFAAGIVAHGIHDIQETGAIPFLANEAWNLNPAISASGAIPLLHNEGVVGSILGGLFGYNTNPTVLEVIAYVVYLGIIFWIYLRIEKISKKSLITNKTRV